MTAPKGRVVCIDLGGTEIKVEVRDYWYQNGKVISKLVLRTTIMTSKPNNPMDDYRRLQRELEMLWSMCGFDGIIVGIAARVGLDGVIAPGGSLNWAGRNLGEMLNNDFQGIPNLVANDGAMFAAYELVFGVLTDPAHHGRGALVVVPGTGIGTCLALWTGDRYMIIPGEGQHNPYDRKAAPSGCNCKGPCYESYASGIMYERRGIDPSRLGEEQDVANMAPPIGALVASYVRPLPSHLGVVVVSGRIAHKRQPLTEAIREATEADLRGYIATPDVVQGSDEAGGTQGGLAYWILFGKN